MMTKTRQAVARAACLLALALLATACQPGQFKVGQNDVNPVAPSELAGGGTFNWPIIQLPSNYNANQVDGALGDEGSVIGALMPSMFSFDAAAQPVLNTNYLSSAQVTGASPMVVTYEINPKAAWSDGTPITAADFAAQWRALNGSNQAYNAAFTQAYAMISSVAQGTSPREVIVTFKSPYGDWRGLFSPLYPASLNSTPSAFNDAWITGTAISAGPFKFGAVDPTAQTVTVVRDPHWWGAPPVLGSIVYHALGGDPTTELKALSKGQIDFATIAPDTSQLKAGKAISGTVVRTAGGPEFRQLTLNGESPNLSDIRVREAVGLALDRPAIAKAMLSPLGVPDAALNNHIYMTNQVGYQNNSGQFTNQDTSRAASLLDQAGWKLAGGVRKKQGQPLALRLLISSGAPEAPQEAGLVKTMLKGVGIQVTVQTIPQTQFFPSYVGTGDFDLALFSWQGNDFPITASQPTYANPILGPNNTIYVGQNYARIGSQEIDQLFAQASAALDSPAAIRLGNQIDTKIWQEVHSLTLYQRPQMVVERSTVANFGAFGFASPDYLTIGFTKS